MIRSLCPAQHLSALNAAMPTDPIKAAATGGVLAQIIALLESLGAQVNWPCLISIIPQVIAAFSNPALILTAITAYFACANPAPAP